MQDVLNHVLDVYYWIRPFCSWMIIGINTLFCLYHLSLFWVTRRVPDINLANCVSLAMTVIMFIPSTNVELLIITLALYFLTSGNKHNPNRPKPV